MWNNPCVQLLFSCPQVVCFIILCAPEHVQRNNSNQAHLYLSYPHLSTVLKIKKEEKIDKIQDGFYCLFMYTIIHIYKTLFSYRHCPVFTVITKYDEHMRHYSHVGITQCTCEFTAKDDTRHPILISCTDCRSFTKLNMLRFLLKYNGMKRVLWR